MLRRREYPFLGQPNLSRDVSTFLAFYLDVNSKSNMSFLDYSLKLFADIMSIENSIELGNKYVRQVRACFHTSSAKEFVYL